MSQDKIIEEATKAMHAEVCCPCDPQGCDWTQTREIRHAWVLADSGLLAWPLPDRDEVTRVLEDTFWPFLAHSPNNPEIFWGQATDMVLALLKGRERKNEER